jgi:hypothetical protein
VARAGWIASAASLGLLVAACSLIAPETFTPEQSLAAATDAPRTTATPRPTLEPTIPASSPAPPPTTAPPPPAAWHRVTKSLAAPAAWLDFGFAANGDVIAIGTRDMESELLHLFVARFSPNGRKREEHNLSRPVNPIPGDWAAVDPRDDSVLIDDYALVSAVFTLRSFSTNTGANVANVTTDSGINRIAIDAGGRVFGLPQYGVDGNAYAAVVRLDARGRVKLGVDYWLRPLDAGARAQTSGILAYPIAIGVGLDGRVIVIDVPDLDATYPDGSPRRSAVVTSLGPNLGSPRQWELQADWPFGSAGFGTWSHELAVAGAADGTIYVGEPVLDEAGAAIVGWRVRAFGADGRHLGSWGAGVGGGELTQASHPAVDAQGRLWVIDTDPATGSSFIAVLSLPA